MAEENAERAGGHKDEGGMMKDELISMGYVPVKGDKRIITVKLHEFFKKLEGIQTDTYPRSSDFPANLKDLCALCGYL